MALDALKILAIDDNADNLITLRAVVRDALPEAAMVAASGGAQGIALALAEDPDVILLDIVMPGMDGYEACRRLKTDERTRHIPVVFLTALRADRESRVRALEAGAEAFLAKPLDEVELTAQIRAMAKIKAANVLARQEQGRLAALVAERTAELERELAERKRTEIALQVETIRRRILFEQLPVGVLVIDPQTARILEFNTVAHQQLGYSREEFAQLSVMDVEAVETATETRARIADVFESGRADFETLQRTRQGEIRHVHVSAQVLDVQGQPLYQCIWRDITERKRTEEALRESEDKFKYVFDHSIVAKSLMLPTGEVNANQAFADLLGYTRAELQNQKWQDITHPDDFALSQNAMTALLSGAETSQRFKKRYLRRDGGVVWTDVSTSLRRDPAGNPLYFMTTLSDITAQVQAEAALRQARDRAQGYLDIAGVMLVAFDTAGKVILINQRGTEILGCRQEEIIGQDWAANFLPLRSRDQVRAVFSRLLAGEVEPVAYFENPVLTQDGEERIIAWHNAALTDAAGRISSILSSGEDITERKRAEEQLRESEARLRAVLDTTPFPIAVVDLADEQIHFWSHSAFTLFGHTAATTAEWYRMAYPDPDYRRAVLARWKPFLDVVRSTRQALNTGEYRVTCRDGSVRVCELYAACLADTLIVTFNDITARRQAEDKIQQQLHELQRWYNATLERETRSLELKHEVNELLHRLNEPIRYPSAEK